MGRVQWHMAAGAVLYEEVTLIHVPPSQGCRPLQDVLKHLTTYGTYIVLRYAGHTVQQTLMAK